MWVAGRHSSHRWPGVAPIRSSVARAECRSAAAPSSTPLGCPVDPEVAIISAVPGWTGRPPGRSRTPSAVCTAAGANVSRIAASRSAGRSGSSGRTAGPPPRRGGATRSSSRPPASVTGRTTACKGRSTTHVRLGPVTAGGVTGRGAAVQLNAQLDDLLGSLRAFAIPMPTRFRGITVREGALIQGPAGWGEFSPFAEYGPRECARWLACAIEAACTGWPEPVRDRVPVNVTVPAVGPERAHDIAASSGCRTAKIKVAEPGQTDADDIARVEAVRDALGPDGRVRVDVNGHWDVPHAARMLAELDRFGLEYAEQPCATVAERRSGGAGPATIGVLKVQPRGGVRPALRIAEACGLPVVVSSAVDTSVGLAAGVALAAALPELPYACGLGTMSLLAGDVTAEPLAAQDGMLPVRRAAVDPAARARWEADPGPGRERAAAAAAYLGEAQIALPQGGR